MKNWAVLVPMSLALLAIAGCEGGIKASFLRPPPPPPDHPDIEIVQNGSNWVFKDPNEKDAETHDLEGGFVWKVPDGYTLGISRLDSKSASDEDFDKLFWSCAPFDNKLRCAKKGPNAIDHSKRFAYKLTVYKGTTALGFVDPFIHYKGNLTSNAQAKVAGN
jgi:hypothetical protein